ncbi:hypothetical protein [Spongiactinospora sp. TRM90649]|uniref:hypothetical protein n=1 Tax=Spongiactinospora sp. TRM90649 TaxID=3031114 RepID=UPI0023F810BC|nr:hypothetical protein [Spongiactinospora sp. TRM90649]MDF5753065.1 hypothetical protein [Spongiactinospora sp. TRM90649]
MKAVYKDELGKPALDVSTKLIGSDKANQAGWTGQGSTIAIIDNGVDRDHPFFAGRIVGEACFSTTDSDPELQAVSLCPTGTTSQSGDGAADVKTAQCMVDKLSDRTLLCYLTIAQNGSKVFPEVNDARSLGKAYKILAATSKAAKALLDRELLAAWFNCAHGVHNGSAKVHGGTTLKQAIAHR